MARYVPGVKRVVSYLETRSGAPVAAAASSFRTICANAAARGAPSAAAINVQKL